MDTIYLLKDQVGNYKIGFTKHSAKNRIKSLQTGNSGNLKVIHEFKTKHKRKVETALHNRFSYVHINREFYGLSDAEVNNFIQTCDTIENGLDVLQSSLNPFYT